MSRKIFFFPIQREKEKFLQMLSFARKRGWVDDELCVNVSKMLDTNSGGEVPLDTITEIRMNMGRGINDSPGLPVDCDEEMKLELISYGAVAVIDELYGKQAKIRKIIDDILGSDHLFHVIHSCFNRTLGTRQDLSSLSARQGLPQGMLMFLQICDGIDGLQTVFISKDDYLSFLGDGYKAFQNTSKYMADMSTLYQNLRNWQRDLCLTIDGAAEIASRTYFTESHDKKKNTVRIKKSLQRHLKWFPRIIVGNKGKKNYYRIAYIAKKLCICCKRSGDAAYDKENSESEWIEVLSREGIPLISLQDKFDGNVVFYGGGRGADIAGRSDSETTQKLDEAERGDTTEAPNMWEIFDRMTDKMKDIPLPKPPIK